VFSSSVNAGGSESKDVSGGLVGQFDIGRAFSPQRWARSNPGRCPGLVSAAPLALCKDEFVLTNVRETDPLPTEAMRRNDLLDRAGLPESAAWRGVAGTRGYSSAWLATVVE
jgi:hypothetical protein